jgi:hypothetical protein
MTPEHYSKITVVPWYPDRLIDFHIWAYELWCGNIWVVYFAIDPDVGIYVEVEK